MIEGAMCSQDIPKTSTPTKKDAVKIDIQKENGTPGGEEDAVKISTEIAAEGGAAGGTLDNGCCGVAPATPPAPLTPTSPQQICPVPEPIAEISSIHDGDSSDVGLRNPDIRPRSAPDILGAELLGSLPIDISSTLSSFMKTTEDFKRFQQGLINQGVRNQSRHSQSVGNIRSLTNSMSSQQDEIQNNDMRIRWMMEDIRISNARLELLEKRHPAGRGHHNRQTTSTHFVPYDSLKQHEQSSFVLPTADLKLQAELFFRGFGSGKGTHLSLRVKADCGDQNETGQLPTQCRFETRVVNFDDEDETRKKSNNSEGAGGSHTVEFPKVIEKEVVENEALGYKRNGTLKITLIVSWDEVEWFWSSG